MDKEKWLKAGLVVLIVAVPFGVTAVGGYYGYKAYKKRQSKKENKLKK